MASHTERSELNDGDRLMSSAASGSHMTHPCRADVKDRYPGAQLLPQSAFSRSAIEAELLVLEPSPLFTPLHILHRPLPPGLQFGNFCPRKAAVHCGVRTTTGSPSAQGQQNCDPQGVVEQETPLAVGEDVSLTSGVCASDSLTRVTNAEVPSLSYTWTDSYLDESPSVTKARWIRQRTFGPVVQSEGGGTSTVFSTPRVHQEAESVWGGLQARNAAARDGAATDVGNQRDEGGGTRRWRDTKDGGGAHARLFDLTATNITGDMRDNSEDDDHSAPDMIERHTIPTPVKPFPDSNKTSPSMCTSDASMLMASVRRPRRAAPAADVKKIEEPPPQNAAVITSTNVNLSPNCKTKVPPSPPAGAHVQKKRLSLEPDSIPATLRTLPPTQFLNMMGTGSSKPMSLPSVSQLRCQWDGTLRSTGEIERARDNLRHPRCGPPRGRVLKSIFED
ncbi:hypothetical protein JKF63_03943 [Porcisia hertigi]|uniref:Uncharacterized protein n=1 Tax=Porcisia hertigi TaxID=2761500 RepID=A0A836L5A6_9TRYP|nr:hypothetical protein JKF63_03943 [Porcisia hertigi]